MNQRTDGFESVVVGRPNTLAVAIAKQVTKGPVRKRSNPFVIEGECGFGKTTILDAIAAGVVATVDGRKYLNHFLYGEPPFDFARFSKLLPYDRER